MATEHAHRPSTPDRAPRPSQDEFIKLSGARSTLLAAFSDQTGEPKQQPTPTKARRRASRLARWVQDQYTLPTDDASVSLPPDAPSSPSTRPNAYLAYPHLSLPARRKVDPDAESLHGYVIIHDEHGLPQIPVLSLDDDARTVPCNAALPSPDLPAPAPASPSPSRFRALDLLRAATPRTPLPPPALTPSHSKGSSSTSSLAVASAASPSTPPAPARLFRGSLPLAHKRSTSLGTPPPAPSSSSSSPRIAGSPPPASTRPAAPLAISPPRASGTWTFRRPSVLGHFTAAPGAAPPPPPPPAPADLAPARPSVSSARTFSTTTTGTTARSGAGAASAYKPAAASLWSLPTDGSHLFDAPGSTALLSEKAGAPRHPLGAAHAPPPPPLERAPASEGCAAALGGGAGGFSLSLPRVSDVLMAQRGRRKRKLVVSGIAAGDTKKVEGVRKWCESFGEVSQLIRTPNGDLHVHFKSAEVAETVCRIRAKVHIAGVGSVCLSWYKGKSP